MAIQTPVIAGNWKLNHSPSQARSFFESFQEKVDLDRLGTIVIFPTAIAFAAARESLKPGSKIQLGVQNIHWESEGAFTGEISAGMAKEAGADLVLVGHSERRHLFGETDEQTAQKTTAGLDAGLMVVLCVGEKLEERESGRAVQVVERQLEAVLPIVGGGDLGRFLVAYEPVWAIGTGKTATPEDASEMHSEIRTMLSSAYPESGSAVPILYGGSVKPDNAQELLSAPHVDGVLVGGASLDPESFAAIWGARS